MLVSGECCTNEHYGNEWTDSNSGHRRWPIAVRGGGGDYQQAEKEEEETFPSIREDYTKVHQEMVYSLSVLEEGLSID